MTKNLEVVIRFLSITYACNYLTLNRKTGKKEGVKKQLFFSVE